MLPLYKKGEESQRPFIDDLVLLIVQKGCSFYAWLRSYVWHDFLWGGMSCAWYFLSFRAFDQRSITLYDETYIWGVHFALCECSTFIMITLDLRIRKGGLGQFIVVIISWFWIGRLRNTQQLVSLRQNGLLELVLLINL